MDLESNPSKTLIGSPARKGQGFDFFLTPFFSQVPQRRANEVFIPQESALNRALSFLVPPELFRSSDFGQQKRATEGAALGVILSGVLIIRPLALSCAKSAFSLFFKPTVRYF